MSIKSNREFYTYSLLLQDPLTKETVLEYIGSGKSDYGDGRGRLEEHAQKIQSAGRKTLNGRNKEFYEKIVYEIQTNKLIFRTKIHDYFTDRDTALASEKRMVHSTDQSKLLNSTWVDDAVKKLELVPVDKISRKTDLVKMAVSYAVNRAEALGHTDVVNQLVDLNSLPNDAIRSGLIVAHEEMNVRKLLGCTIPEDSEKRYDYFEKLEYNANRLREAGLDHLALDLEKHMASVKKTVRYKGIRISKANMERAELLKAHPEWHNLPYTAIASHLNTGWANVARIMALLGYVKHNAKTSNKQAKADAVLNDPERSTLTNLELAKKHGIGIMTLYRYLKTEKV